MLRFSFIFDEPVDCRLGWYTYLRCCSAVVVIIGDVLVAVVVMVVVIVIDVVVDVALVVVLVLVLNDDLVLGVVIVLLAIFHKVIVLVDLEPNTVHFGNLHLFQVSVLGF